MYVTIPIQPKLELDREREEEHIYHLQGNGSLHFKAEKLQSIYNNNNKTKSANSKIKQFLELHFFINLNLTIIYLQILNFEKLSQK